MPAVVDRKTCDACATRERQECVFVCPYDAIGMVGGKASVDREKCDDCKLCVETCPIGAIALE